MMAFVVGALILPAAGFCLALMAIADSVAYEMFEVKQLYLIRPLPESYDLARNFPTNFSFPFELSIVVLFLLAVPCLAASVWAIATRQTYWGRGVTALSGLIIFFLLLASLGTSYKMQQYASEGPDAFYGSPTGIAEMGWAGWLFLAGSLTCWLTNIWFRMLERNPGWEAQTSAS
jgi:NADH:ubiquinone oxidoreductase subunit 6 (subunit J)